MKITLLQVSLTYRDFEAAVYVIKDESRFRFGTGTIVYKTFYGTVNSFRSNHKAILQPFILEFEV